MKDFKSPLPINDKTRHRISKDTENLKNISKHFDLPNTYRAIHPTMAEYTFFSNSHGMFTKANHILWHKRSIKFED